MPWTPVGNHFSHPHNFETLSFMSTQESKFVPSHQLANYNSSQGVISDHQNLSFASNSSGVPTTLDAEFIQALTCDLINASSSISSSAHPELMMAREDDIMQSSQRLYENSGQRPEINWNSCPPSGAGNSVTTPSPTTSMSFSEDDKIFLQERRRTTSCDDTSLVEHASNARGSLTTPRLVIVEQPTNRIRYRYKSEKGSHGGLTGENNCQAKKTYPSVRLDNYPLTTHVVIKAFLVTSEEVNPRPHVHKLMGRNCSEDGSCMVPLGHNDTAVFQNLGILFMGKKEVPDILYSRKVSQRSQSRGGGNLSDIERQQLRAEAEKEAKIMNLNSVRICFEAYDLTSGINSSPICSPIFSRSIANQKSPDSGELKIIRMDRHSGSVAGDEEVFLLCEKVNKKDIKVRFFEVNTEGQKVWESFGTFSESDVHHQVAIVFRTPAYSDQSINRSVQAFVQLYRPKDGEYSEARPFVFYPKETIKLSTPPDLKKRRLPQQQQLQSHLTEQFKNANFQQQNPSNNEYPSLP